MKRSILILLVIIFLTSNTSQATLLPPKQKLPAQWILSENKDYVEVSYDEKGEKYIGDVYNKDAAKLGTIICPLVSTTKSKGKPVGDVLIRGETIDLKTDVLYFQNGFEIGYSSNIQRWMIFVKKSGYYSFKKWINDDIEKLASQQGIELNKLVSFSNTYQSYNFYFNLKSKLCSAIDDRPFPREISLIIKALIDVILELAQGKETVSGGGPDTSQKLSDLQKNLVSLKEQVANLSLSLGSVAKSLQTLQENLGLLHDTVSGKEGKAKSIFSASGGGPSVAGDGKEHDIFISLVRGDITEQKFADYKTAAIVNAANGWIQGGGGIDAAIHGAAGSSALKKENKLGNIVWLTSKSEYPLKAGGAVITKSCELETKRQVCSYVIHAVGPDISSNPTGPDGKNIPTPDDTKKLKSAYLNSLMIADMPADHDKIKWGINEGKSLTAGAWKGLTSIALCCISTAIFSYPIELATPEVLNEVFNYLKDRSDTCLQEIRFVTFSDKDYTIYASELKKYADTKKLVEVNPLPEYLTKRWDQSKSSFLDITDKASPPLCYKYIRSK